MKIKTDFVTNSSSTSFVITNKTNMSKTIKDFLEENPQLVEDFRKEYGGDESTYTQEKMLEAIDDHYSYTFAPKKYNICTFGDEDCNIVGVVFDYMLRYGGKSKSFEWRYHESHR